MAGSTGLVARMTALAGVMARERCDPHRAFDLLRAASQCSHVKLCDVARFLVDSAAARDAVRLDSGPGSAGNRARTAGGKPLGDAIAVAPAAGRLAWRGPPMALPTGPGISRARSSPPREPE